MSDDVAERAHAFLRAHAHGDLRFDEHLRPLKYVITPEGRLVAPVMVAMIQAPDTVLFVPEAIEGAMELQVTLEQFDEHGESGQGALADRWRIHHGDPPDVNWALLDIDAARFDGMIVDGPGLVRTNPLGRDEPRICKEMNHDHVDDLRRMCLHYAELSIETPVMVAIDPLGIDVRGQFSVVRVNAPETMQSADDALRVLAMMGREAQSAVTAGGAGGGGG